MVNDGNYPGFDTPHTVISYPRRKKEIQVEHIDVPSQYIELVFENCDCIHVDVWALKSLRMNTDSERYEWEEQKKEMLKFTLLKNLYMEFDTKNPRHFYHTPRVIPANKPVGDDGFDCIKRIKSSDDLTHIYVNGQCYQVPWKSEPYESILCGSKITCYKNSLQQNAIITNTSGEEFLSVEINGAEEGSGVF